MLFKLTKFRLSLSVILDSVCIIPASVKKLGFSEIKFSMDFKKDNNCWTRTIPIPTIGPTISKSVPTEKRAAIKCLLNWKVFFVLSNFFVHWKCNGFINILL